MNKLKLLGLLMIIPLLLSLGSCVTKVNMNSKFYNGTTKVGIIMKVDSANVTKMGSQGLLDMAISSGRKYKEPLKTI